MQHDLCAVGKNALDAIQVLNKLVIKFVLWFMQMVSLVISVPRVWLMAQNLNEVIWMIMEPRALNDSGMRDIAPFPLELE